MLKVLYKFPLHPFEEFHEIRRKEVNNFPAAMLTIFMLFISSVIEYQYTDFVFNMNRIDHLNIWLMMLKTVFIFLLWVIANWSFCTLFDGEGNLNQIFCLSAFSLIPYILAVLLKTALSGALISDEGIFLEWIVTAGKIYSGILMLAGLHIVHGYPLKKTLFSAAISVVGIAIILFIFTLLFSLFQQFCAFFMTIFTEISLIIQGGSGN